MAESQEDDFSEIGNVCPKCCPMSRDVVWELVRPFVDLVPPGLPEPVEFKKRWSVFARYARQVEGWFRGELMFILDQLAPGQWQPEAGYDWNHRCKCDFELQLPRQDDGGIARVGVELKTAFVGRQGQNVYHLNYILDEGAGEGGGLLRDASRLTRSTGLAERVCLVYAYGRQDAFFTEGIDETVGLTRFVEQLSNRGELCQFPFRAELMCRGWSRTTGNEMALLSFAICIVPTC